MFNSSVNSVKYLRIFLRIRPLNSIERNFYSVLLHKTPATIQFASTSERECQKGDKTARVEQLS